MEYRVLGLSGLRVDLLTKYGICFPLPESHQSRLFMERRDQSDYKSVEMYC